MADLEEVTARAALAAAAPLEAAIRDLMRALRFQAGLYDTAALAELFGVGSQTVRKWRRLYGLPCRRVGGPGGTALFLRDEVMRWLERMPPDVRASFSSVPSSSPDAVSAPPHRTL